MNNLTRITITLILLAASMTIGFREGVKTTEAKYSSREFEIPLEKVAVYDSHAPEFTEPEIVLLDPEPRLPANRIGNVTLTHYCICKKCCGKNPSDPGYGITASGRTAEPGVSVAVDPRIIPLGANVVIEYPDGTTKTCRADDTGSAIKSNHIDLCMASHEEALQAGVKNVTIYWEVE